MAGIHGPGVWWWGWFWLGGPEEKKVTPPQLWNPRFRNAGLGLSEVGFAELPIHGCCWETCVPFLLTVV